MGYRARIPAEQKHRHRRGKPCYACIRELEIECGLREPDRLPMPPRGPGGGSVAVRPRSA